MSRPGTKLTKTDLLNDGIIDVIYNKSEDNWTIIRDWYISNSRKKKVRKTIKVSNTKDKHPFGRTFSAPIVSYSGRNTTLGRFVYAWIKGEVPEGKKVHIKGPTLEFNETNYILKDVKDHSYYEHSNATIAAKNYINELSRRLERYSAENFLKYYRLMMDDLLKDPEERKAEFESNE